MARKKSASNIKDDILGIVLITAGCLSLFSVFSNSSGILGRWVRQLLLGVMGLGAFIMPFLIIFIGFCYIVKKGKINFNKKFYGIIVFIVDTLFLIQMINMNKYYDSTSITTGISKIYYSNSIMHGGILSFLIDIPLFKLFGLVGCYIIFVALYIISSILILQVSLYDILTGLNLKVNFKLGSKKKKKEVKDVIEEKSIVSDAAVDVDKGDYLKNVNSRIKILDFMKSSNSIEKKEEVKPRVEPSPGKSINDDLEKEILENSNKDTTEYVFPSAELLNLNNLSKLNKEDKRELINNASKLEETLSSFGVDAKVVQVAKGPSVTRFELQPSAGVKVSKIVNLADDIALNLAASGVRIEAPIPGKAAVGIEVPNRELSPVYLREVIESAEFSNSNKGLSFSLGKDIAGNCVVSDLTKMPHMLIAGATGSGKSVCINTLIISLLYKYSPAEVKLLMVDPKVVELSVYNGIPHLLIPVVTDPKKAASALNWAVNEMGRRYKLFADNGVRNIESYNELVSKGKLSDKLPIIVIIVDELADLMMACANEVEDYIGRLAQMARAAGMHLVIATQRPSVDVITGVIKANIPSRISFAVSSQIDSRTILDSAGAEKLLGKGDMLFYPVGESKPIRIQGAFISEDEVEKVVSFIKNQEHETEYKTELLAEINSPNSNDQVDTDELMDEAIRIVVEAGQASTSLLQRRLRIGYNRAARIIEQMEEMNIISSKDGSKPRQVLVDKTNDDNYNYFQGND